jgi:hypothetical protein
VFNKRNLGKLRCKSKILKPMRIDNEVSGKKGLGALRRDVPGH